MEKTDKEKRIQELWQECMEDSPDMDKIEEMLDGLSDISELYAAFGAEDDECYVFLRNDFLSRFIDEYMQTINKFWFGYEKYDEKLKQWVHVPPREPRPMIMRETHARDMILVFLEHGYDPKAVDGKVGLACLDALVWSNFNDELVNIADMLIKAGADPSLKTEDGDNILDAIDWHRGGSDWYYEGIEDDDYLDNRDALDAYYDLCERWLEWRKRQRHMTTL